MKAASADADKVRAWVLAHGGKYEPDDDPAPSRGQGGGGPWQRKTASRIPRFIVPESELEPPE